MTTDELSAAKAEFNRQINTNQNQAQALLEIETADVENSLQADSFAYTWFQQVPELLFNPFQDEEPTEQLDILVRVLCKKEHCTESSLSISLPRL